MEPTEPVAESCPTRSDPRRTSRIGVAKDSFTVLDSFFEPLPDDILKAFAGELPEDQRKL